MRLEPAGKRVARAPASAWVLAVALLLWTLASSGCLAAPGPGGSAAIGQSAVSADPAASQPATAGSCSSASDALDRIKCRGAIRVGVRKQYPPFAYFENGQYRGFEVALARELAGALGVAAELQEVTPANRIAALGEGRADLTIATMGHTVQRDAEALFVRPHYYQSRTVIVGRRAISLEGLAELRGQPVCVTIGNNSNADLSATGARLLLFDRAPQLVDQLRQGACSLAAQDDTFFAPWLRTPEFSAQFDVKFGFAEVPWGMAVSRADGTRLQAELARIVTAMHADGRIRRLAQAHGVDSPFLESQERRWSTLPCSRVAAPVAGCLDEPRDNRLLATPFAGEVAALEQRIRVATGIKMTLAMLKTRVAFDLFLQGLGFTLLMMVGSVLTTCGLGVALAQGLDSGKALVRWPVRGVVAMLQSSPMILLMLLAGILVSAGGVHSVVVSAFAAVLMLGLFNGSNVGQAVAEVRDRLRRESDNRPVSLSQALLSARPQVVAFCMNAVRGSPAAALIGVPELLSALTDIASFSSERVTTYLVLLVVYVLMIALLFALAGRLQRWFDARQVRAA